MMGVMKICSRNQGHGSFYTRECPTCGAIGIKIIPVENETKEKTAEGDLDLLIMGGGGSYQRIEYRHVFS